MKMLIKVEKIKKILLKVNGLQSDQLKDILKNSITIWLKSCQKLYSVNYLKQDLILMPMFCASKGTI